MAVYIEINNIQKNYGSKTILNNINTKLNISSPSIIGIIGNNGAGKSTFLKTISGILLPNSGKITVTNLTEKYLYEKWAKKNIAYIQSGERGLKLKNTAKDNIIYYGLLKGAFKKEVLSSIDKYSPLMGLENLLERKCENLSMGEKKKVQIMCGICSGVGIIILDEPSNGLDITAVYELKKIIQYIKNKQGKIVIIASHEIQFLESIATKYIFMHDGRIDTLVETDLTFQDIDKIIEGKGILKK